MQCNLKNDTTISIHFQGKPFNITVIQVYAPTTNAEESEMQYLRCNLKNDRTISIHFQGKPFNITVIQVYAPTSNTEEAEVEQFYEDLHLQDLLELTPQKDVFFIIGDWNAKVGSQETPRVTGSLALEYRKKQGKTL